MKRYRLSHNATPLLLTLSLFLVLTSAAFAQGGSGELPGSKPTKPTPTPTPKPGGARGARPAPPPAPVTPTIAFNQEMKGLVDPRGSQKDSSGQFFEEFILNAKGDELLAFDLVTDNPALTVQVLDKDKNSIALGRDGATGPFKIKTPAGGLPAEGEYRVRVGGPVTGRTAIPFNLIVNRLGLLPNVYNERLQQIVLNFRENEPASVDETVTKLEALVSDDNWNKPGAIEFLGIVYLYNRKDMAKAEQAMAQAIKANGAAVIRISYDAQWRRIARLRTGRFDFEDPRTGWLRIRPGQLVFTDPSNKPLATVAGSAIKEVSKVFANSNYMVTLVAENVRRPFIFLPGTREQAEADLVIKLITTHVVGK